jgi:N-glycosylase/DNA lyase
VFMEEIKNRISEFKNFDRDNGKRVFEELVFCLLTPQSKALNSDKAVKELVNKNLLFDGNVSNVSGVLKNRGVRFHNVKAERIVNARKLELVFDRDWLVENVVGFGLKEASHFLRNVGVFNYAILDRHVLKNLVANGVINEIPVLNRKNYLLIEEKFREYAMSQELTVEELDLLFWSKETGMVFK